MSRLDRILEEESGEVYLESAEKLKQDSTKQDSKAIAVCPVCPQACRLTSTSRATGLCGARVQKVGSVVSSTYGSYTSLALDPIEKKPLACYRLGSKILSIGSYGCNLDCPFCQNWEIARPASLQRQDSPISRQKRMRNAFGQALSKKPESNLDNVSGARSMYKISPASLVEKACELKNQGNIGIAYTYNEPLVAYEFVCDTAELAHNAGLKNVLVTNGYANPAIIKKVFEHIDAANIDLKGFSQDFYDFIDAPNGLSTVKQTIAYAAQHCHLELTTLVIPGLNDDLEQIAAQAEWIASIDPDIPLHLSRFFPTHRMLDKPPTPRATLARLKQVASEHLHHVYLGNV